MFIEIEKKLINLDNVVTIEKAFTYAIIATTVSDERVEIYCSRDLSRRDDAYNKLKKALNQCNLVKKVEL